MCETLLAIKGDFGSICLPVDWSFQPDLTVNCFRLEIERYKMETQASYLKR